ncbi:MAG: hypothetical protein ACRDLB_03145 [Actinomycetota bacterium]
MKKALIFALVIGLIAGAMAAPATAKKKKKKKKPVKVERTVSGTYQAPTLVIAGQCAQTDAIGCVPFTAASTEKYMSVTITDSSGLPVSASIQQDTNGDGQEDITVASFCGATTEPVPVDPTYPLDVWVDNIPNPDCPGALATQGTVDVILSNLP